MSYEKKQILKIIRPLTVLGKGPSFCVLQNKTRSINANVWFTGDIEKLFEDRQAASIYVYGSYERGVLHIIEIVEDRSW
jgi:hypothetical protein